MSDNLILYGSTFSNVAGFKAKNTSNSQLTFIRPQGSLNISSNNTYDVSQYASAVVNVSGGSGIDIPVFTVTFDSNWEEVQSVTCNKTFSECLALYEDHGYEPYPAYVIYTIDGNEEFVGSACVYAADSTIIYFAITPDLHADITYDRLGQIDYTALPSQYADNITITQNGVYDPTNFDYRPFWGVTVSVPSPTLSTLSVTQNGTYTAPQGSAYDEVNVTVPNTYSASDEGKVVSNGALVAQTSDTVTTNDTYDTTLINSLTVNVSGGTTVASGTFTGAGAYEIAVSVGTKMPKTDFWVKFVAQSDTEFAYDTKYKPAYMFAMVTSDNGHFDLSSVGNGKQVISDLTFDVNNSGTITSVASGSYIGQMTTIRNTSANNGKPNNFRISRKSDHFEVGIFHSNGLYAYPAGIKYDWEVVYFGSNPSTDIVEIS